MAIQCIISNQAKILIQIYDVGIWYCFCCLILLWNSERFFNTFGRFQTDLGKDKIDNIYTISIDIYHHYSSFNHTEQRNSRPKAQQLICLYSRQMQDAEPLCSQIAHFPPKAPQIEKDLKTSA